MIGRDEVPADLWAPNLMMPNAINLDEESLFQGSAGLQIANMKTGQMQFHRNIQSSFSCSFNLRKFPFDEHILALRFNVSYNEHIASIAVLRPSSSRSRSCCLLMQGRHCA